MWACGWKKAQRKSTGCCIHLWLTGGIRLIGGSSWKVYRAVWWRSIHASGCQEYCCCPVSEQACCCFRHLCWPLRLSCWWPGCVAGLLCCDREGVWIINEQKQLQSRNLYWHLNNLKITHCIFIERKPDYLQHAERGNCFFCVDVSKFWLTQGSFFINFPSLLNIWYRLF